MDTKLSGEFKGYDIIYFKKVQLNGKCAGKFYRMSPVGFTALSLNYYQDRINYFSSVR